jgi:acetyl esterase
MASTPTHALHKDYRRIPSMDLRFNRVLLGLINCFLACDRFFAKRRADARVSRREEIVSNADGSSFKVIVMHPETAQPTAPALVYYPGGGFALHYSSLHLQSCERYALEVGCVVVFVVYRLGLSKPFPHSFDDSYRALEWTREQSSQLGIDPSRVAVMGDSAGGCLSAAVAQKALDQSLPLAAQVLVYPTLDNTCSTASANEFTNTPIWTAGSNRGMWKMYLRDVDSQNPPAYAAPAGREDLTGLAPAYVETAEFDPLRDEGIEYAARLDEAGVQIHRNFTSGTIHGYEMSPKNPETLRSMKARIAYLRERLGTS